MQVDEVEISSFFIMRSSGGGSWFSCQRLSILHPLHFSTLHSERFTASEQWEFYSRNGFSGYFPFSLKISVEKIV